MKIARQALEVAEKTFGPEHLCTSTSLNNLAELYRLQGRYSDAEPLYQRALAIREKTFGPNHQYTATSLNNLAELYHFQCRNSEAEALYRRALEIDEKTLGPEHCSTAMTLNNLAGLYKNQGRYSEAEPLYRRALEITEKAFGLNHNDTARLLNNLAGLYQLQGRYSESELLLKRALAIREKVLGPDHPGTATMMNNLAELYREQGRYSDAEPLCRRALEIREKGLGPEHPYIARSLNHLAELYRSQCAYSDAEKLLKRALTIQEKRLGPNHLDTVLSLNNLAGLYCAQGRYLDAEPLYKRALAVYEKALGPEHPYTATSLNNLAGLYRAQGKYLDAEPLYKRALTIYEKALGPNHPDTALILNNLALLLAATGRSADALPLMQRALSINDDTIRDVFTLATEKEKFAFLATVQSNYDCFMNLVVQKLKEKPEALTAGLNGALRRKGIVLEALSRERNALMESEKPEVKALYRKMQGLTSLISSLTMAGPGKTPMEEYRTKLKNLESERERAEKDLTTSSSAYALQKRSHGADCITISKKLPPGSALVEYLCMPIFDFKATGNRIKWGGSRYFAFVLISSQGNGSSSGKAASPQLVDLGEASAIDEEVKEFRAEIARAGTLWESGILNEASAENALAGKGRRLYDLVVFPIKKALGERTTLFLAPDADLNLIPFGALQDETGKYLAEKYSLYYLSCGRDLLRFEGKAENNGETVIVANPDFDTAASERAASTKGHPVKDDFASTGRATRSADLAVSEWNSLPGTRAEAEAIEKVLQGERIQAYQGRSALEETVKSLHSPGRLHIATHGFFLEDREESSPRESTMQDFSSVSAGQAMTPDDVKIENPLLRSGVVLAGANRLGREPLQEGCDDGILTALEISGLSLRGTDLVVLSACDTGIGQVHKGEGVFGLGRAFHLAGARTVVMSLWSVPDQETRELMTGFYERLKKGEGKASALQGASIAMMKERREKFGAAHPFFWASFICIGEP
ncbi:MAG: tetratricopeptide repeat protein [Vulcanimicrobiota bacterium]